MEKGLREKFSEGPVRAVIFDMDGVIFDSERLVWLEWCAISEKYGLGNIWEVYRKCIGVTETRTRELFWSSTDRIVHMKDIKRKFL